MFSSLKENLEMLCYLPSLPPPKKKISEEQIIVQYWIICFASEATPK